MALLDGFRAAQVGPGLAAAVCGRLLADVGAEVVRIDPSDGTTLAAYLNRGPRALTMRGALAGADLVICKGSPAALQRSGRDVAALRRLNARAAIVLISPFWTDRAAGRGTGD